MSVAALLAVAAIIFALNLSLALCHHKDDPIDAALISLYSVLVPTSPAALLGEGTTLAEVKSRLKLQTIVGDMALMGFLLMWTFFGKPHIPEQEKQGVLIAGKAILTYTVSCVALLPTSLESASSGAACCLRSVISTGIFLGVAFLGVFYTLRVFDAV